MFVFEYNFSEKEGKVGLIIRYFDEDNFVIIEVLKNMIVIKVKENKDL